MRCTADITVAHSVYQWLPLTENWIHRQAESQKRYTSIILASQLTLSYPHFGELYASDNLPFICRFANKILRGLTDRDVFKDSILSRYDNVLLHSHFGPTGWSDIHLRNKKRHITRFYGYDIDKLPNTQPIWQERYKVLFERCTAFLVEGPFMKQSLVKRGCPPEKIYVHALGTDVERIPYKQRHLNGRLKILMAGRFTEKKGMVYAIEGIAKAYNDLQCKDMAVTIIGDSDGSEQSEKYKTLMMDLISENKIDHIIHWVGMKSYEEMMQIALDHNLFLNPSVTAADGDCEGGYPVVLLDMLASGMPVASTVHCDIPEVISDARLGILSKERDSDGIARVLQDIVIGKTTFDSRVISDHIRNTFNWGVKGAELAAIYEQVMR